jgi:hypothetical protein
MESTDWLGKQVNVKTRLAVVPATILILAKNCHWCKDIGQEQYFSQTAT